MSVNWNEYERYLDQKIKDAEYNLEKIEKDHRQAKAILRSLLIEKKGFRTALQELMKDTQ